MQNLIQNPKWLVLAGIFVFTFFVQLGACSVPLSYGQESPTEEVEVDCPEGYKCVPSDVAAKWKNILEQRQCMDKALEEQNEDLQLLFEDYHVILTRDGQVFDKDNMVATLKWCDYTVEFHTKPNLIVSMKDTAKNEKTWGFRLRVRLGINTWPKTLFTEADEPLTETVVLFEPFFVQDFHISTYAGFETFGLVVGMDLTRNLDIFGGVGGRWGNAELGPVLGLSLSFN